MCRSPSGAWYVLSLHYISHLNWYLCTLSPYFTRFWPHWQVEKAYISGLWVKRVQMWCVPHRCLIGNQLTILLFRSFSVFSNVSTPASGLHPRFQLCWLQVYHLSEALFSISQDCLAVIATILLKLYISLGSIYSQRSSRKCYPWQCVLHSFFSHRYWQNKICCFRCI